MQPVCNPEALRREQLFQWLEVEEFYFVCWCPVGWEDLCFPQTEQKQHFGWFGRAGESFQGWFGRVGEEFEVFDLSRVSSTAALGCGEEEG